MNSKADGSSQLTGALISGLFTDIGRLFTNDLELAKLEIQEGASRAKSVVSLMAMGAFLGTIGFLMLVIAVAHLITATTAIPLWGAYGIVGIVLGGLGMTVLLMGRRRATSIDMTPQRAGEALKEDWAWMTSRINESWQSVNRREQH